MTEKVTVEFYLNVNDVDLNGADNSPVLVLESFVKAASLRYMMVRYYQNWWRVQLEQFDPGTIIPYRYVIMKNEEAATICRNHAEYQEDQQPSAEEMIKYWYQHEVCRRHVQINWVDCQVVDKYKEPCGMRYYNDSEVTFITHYQTTPGFELAVVGLPPLLDMPRKATYTEGSFWRFTTKVDRWEKDWNWHWEVLWNDKPYRKEDLGEGRLLARLPDSFSQVFRFDWDQRDPKESRELISTRNRFGVLHNDDLYRCGQCNKEIDCPEENIRSSDPCQCPDKDFETDDSPPAPPEGPGDSGSGGEGSGSPCADDAGTGDGWEDREKTGSAPSPASGDSGQQPPASAPQDEPSAKDESETEGEDMAREQEPFSDSSPATEDTAPPEAAVEEDEVRELIDDIPTTQDTTLAAVEATVEECTDQRSDTAPSIMVEEVPEEQASLAEQGAEGPLPTDSDQASNVRAPVSWYVNLAAVSPVPTLRECVARELSLIGHLDTGKVGVHHPKLSCIEETEEQGFTDIPLDGVDMEDEEVELIKNEFERDLTAEADERFTESRSQSTTSHITSSTDALTSELDSSDTLQDIIEGILAECESDSESLPEMYTLTTIAESNEMTEESGTRIVGVESSVVGPDGLQVMSTTLTLDKEMRDAEDSDIHTPTLKLPIQEENGYALVSATETVSPEQKMISEIRHQLQRLKVAEKAGKHELSDANVTAETMREIQDRHAFSPETSSKTTARIVEKDAHVDEEGAIERPPSPVAELLEKEEEETEVKEPCTEKEDSANEVHESKETTSVNGEKSERDEKTKAETELEKPDGDEKEKSDADKKENKSGEGKGQKGKGRQGQQNPPAADVENAAHTKSDSPRLLSRPGSDGDPNSPSALVKQRLLLLSRDVLPDKTESPTRMTSNGEKIEAKGQGKSKKQGDRGDKPEAVNIILQERERASGGMGSPELKRARFSQNQNRRGSRSTSNLLHNGGGGGGGGGDSQRQQGGQGREEGHVTLTPGTKRRHDSRGNQGRSEEERGAGGGNAPGSGSKRRGDGRNRRNSDPDQRTWSRSHNAGNRQEGRFGPHFPGGQAGDEKFGRPGGPEARREEEHMGGRGGRGGPGGRRGRERDMFFDSPRVYGNRSGGHFEWQPHDRPGDRSGPHGGERGGMHLEEGVGPFDRPRLGQPRFGWPQLGIQGTRGPSEWPQPGMLPPRPNRRGMPPLKPVPPLPMDPRCDPLRPFPVLRNDIR